MLPVKFQSFQNVIYFSFTDFLKKLTGEIDKSEFLDDFWAKIILVKFDIFNTFSKILLLKTQIVAAQNSHR